VRWEEAQALQKSDLEGNVLWVGSVLNELTSPHRWQYLDRTKTGDGRRSRSARRWRSGSWPAPPASRSCGPAASTTARAASEAPWVSLSASQGGHLAAVTENGDAGARLRWAPVSRAKELFARVRRIRLLAGRARDGRWSYAVLYLSAVIACAVVLLVLGLVALIRCETSAIPAIVRAIFGRPEPPIIRLELPNASRQDSGDDPPALASCDEDELAVAAAEMVATINGHPLPPIPDSHPGPELDEDEEAPDEAKFDDEAVERIGRTRPASDPQLTDLARRAVAGISAPDSYLYQSWFDDEIGANYAPQWRAFMGELAAKLAE
jgi:hypothetical protein